MKIRPVGVELFHTDAQKEIDMMKLIIAFPNCANAPKKTLFGSVFFTK